MAANPEHSEFNDTRAVSPALAPPLLLDPRVDSLDPAPTGSGTQLLSLAKHACRRWWHWCLPAGIVLALAGITITWLTFKPVYEAVAWLKIESTSPFLAYAENGHGITISKGDDVFVRTQMALIRSPVVLEPVLKEPEIASIPEIRVMQNPVRSLGRAISVKSEDDSEIYHVGFAASAPADAAKVVNAVLSEYTKFQDNVGRERSQRIIRILDQEIATRNLELAGLRAKVRDLTRQLNGADAVARTDAATGAAPEHNELNEWQAKLGASQVERTVLEATLQALQESSKKSEVAPSEAAIRNFVDQQYDVQKQRRIVENERAYFDAQSMIRTKDRNSSEWAALQNRVAQAEVRLKELEKAARERALVVLQSEARSEEQSQINKQIRDTRAQIASHQMLESLLSEKITQQRQSRRGTGDLSTNLELARRDLARAEMVHELLLKRMNELTTETRAPSRVEVLRPAAVPTDPLETLPWRLFSLAAALGLLLPFGLACLVELHAQRITEGDQLELTGRRTLLGEITALPNRPRLSSPTAEREFLLQRAAFEDSVRYLCHSLLLSFGKELRTVALTSAMSGEGKTSLCAQLAASMAECLCEPVILIDSDTRDPDLHKAFDSSVSPGLVDVLSGTCSLEEAIRTTPVNNLHLLPAGKARSQGQLLSQHEQMKQLLRELRSTYRCIVLDTPPALTVGESLSTCALADGVLICALRDVSRQRQIQLVQQRLQFTGVRVLGVVLSGVLPRAYALKYGAYVAHQADV